ncbi:MAG: adenylate cyclase-like protein [uncultured bacterium]|nr:MAG: adenylate cyclase-like protein [uncultured bacterium]
MPAESANRIKRSIDISAFPLLIAWFLVLVLPLAGSLLAIDYFIAEYALFAEPGEIEKARQRIEECRDLLVTENFLTSRLPILENLILPAELQTPDDLKQAVDKVIFGRGMMYVFFDKTGSQLTMRNFRPADLKKQMPPAALFRKPVQTAIKANYLFSAYAEAEDSETLRNALQLQQMFKTIAPVFIRTGQVVKNYSVEFGGEIFFAYFEFRKPQAGQKGCLAVIRGRDLSWPQVFRNIRQKHPAFNIVLKKSNIQKAVKRPGAFFCGIERKNDTIVITAPADQRFIRSWLHKSGNRLDQKNPEFRIPFIEYHLSTESFQHNFQKMRKNLGLAATVLIMLSLIQLMHMLLFGINLDISFKRRILASVMLVSLFPFAFLSIGFYLHQQYDEFLARLNMLQHVEISLAQNNNELRQFLERIESSFIAIARTIDKQVINDDATIQKLFAEIGRQLPISAVAVHRPQNTIATEFPDRVSPGSRSSTVSFVERFVPRRTLDLLLEPEPILNRDRQDMIVIAGNLVKNAAIAEGMSSNGKLYYVDQTQSVIWYSTLKLYDERDPAMPFIGLMGGKFEAGPLLDSYLRQTSLASRNFEETYGNYSVKYAFLPTERTGMKKIWAGSGFKDEALIKKAAKLQSSNTLVETDKDGKISYLISRYNHNIPHVAVACATSGQRSGSYLSAISGLLVYLCLVFYLVGQLLEWFFVNPVLRLARSAEQIARGNDVWNLSLPTGDEFEQLNNSFAELVVGLQQRNMLRDYVSEDAISQIELSETKDMAPGGEYIEATIIFAAIKNYADLTADFTPEQTVELINRFITSGDNLVKKHGGTIDKIIDNTLMLVFRDSETQTDSHALRAVKTALELTSEMHLQNLDIYAGIASGTVISGRIGSYSGKLDFTVIGDQVNLAARLKNEAIDSASGLIISGSTMRQLKGAGRVNFLRRCSLKGKSREYNIYELYELR